MEDSQEAVIVDSQENGSSFHPSFTVDGAGGEGTAHSRCCGPS